MNQQPHEAITQVFQDNGFYLSNYGRHFKPVDEEAISRETKLATALADKEGQCKKASIALEIRRAKLEILQKECDDLEAKLEKLDGERLDLQSEIYDLEDSMEAGR